MRLTGMAAVVSLWLAFSPGLHAQGPPADDITDAELAAAIDRLGDLNYDRRTAASRVVRRAPASLAVPMLRDAITGHQDGYVRYRALVLLTAFDDPQTASVMRDALSSPNDRLRTVAYSYFELNPDPDMADQLLSALDRELAEFVRPALVRALAALDNEDVHRVLTREAGRGEDFFRSVVIEALGDFKAAYAVDAISAIAKLEGPLQDDAAFALGKIGDKRALETLSELQRSAPDSLQPTLAAAICLLGINCGSHETFVIESLKFADSHPGYQDLLRGAAAALSALAVSGRSSALDALLSIGIPSNDPTRAPVSLAVATVALRNTPLMLSTLESWRPRGPAILLMGEGFDMLEEDLLKERFFSAIRGAYWDASKDASVRPMLQEIMGRLEF